MASRVVMGDAVLAWSGGKDAAYALHELRARGEAVAELLTTINGAYDRSTMHGVRSELYRRQAERVGLPLNAVTLPPGPSNDEYDAAMSTAMSRCRERGIDRIVYADIYLEDVREYREERLAGSGIDGQWPIWGRDTTEVARDVVDCGFEAIVVAVDGRELDASYAGRRFDEGFLDDLPDGVDPCGENGEFHTFVVDGPIFRTALPVHVGEVVTRNVADASFYYTDLVVHGER